MFSANKELKSGKATLPSELLQQINSTHSPRSKSKKPIHSISQRKQNRKEKQILKKQRKEFYFNHKKSNAPNSSSSIIPQQSSVGKRKIVELIGDRVKKTNVNGKTKKLKLDSKSVDTKSAAKSKKTSTAKRQIEDLKKSNPGFARLLEEENLLDLDGVDPVDTSTDKFDEDEMEIQRYSKLLGIKSKKGVADILGETGFEDLLKFSGYDSGDESHSTKKSRVDQNEDESDEEEFEADEDVNALLDQFEVEDVTEDENEENEEDEEQLEEEDDDEMHSHEESNDEDFESEEENEQYTDAKDSETQPISSETAAKYVPPHLRNKNGSESKSESYMRLKRQLQGLINRLSDANMESIVNSIDELYRNNSRHDMTEIITETILNVVSDHANLLDSFVLTYAGFISCIFHVIGSDIGATITQTILEQYDKAHTETIKMLTAENNGEINESVEAQSKKSTNLISLVACLYNLEVVSSVLVYDIVREAIKGFTELDVEILLKLIKLSGQQMRSDDPTALKDIVELVKTEITNRDQSEVKISTRCRFMLETITELKNNRVRKGVSGANADANAIQLERMKKFVGMVIKKRQINGSEPLRMSMSDIRNVKTRGKWWLVGSAWTPSELMANNNSKSKKSTTTTKSDGDDQKKSDNLMEKLMLLARKQKMNTDVRKNIFVVLMSSDDYLDAFERLEKLGLKDKQEREIIRVLLHCCGQEKVYNPYYALVAKRFCEHSHGHKITLQYALWDYLNAVADDQDSKDSAVDVKKTSNYAKLFGYLVSVQVLNLSIIKVLNFMDLTSRQKLFAQLFFTTLLTTAKTSDEQIESIFQKFKTHAPEMKDSLGFFMDQYLVPIQQEDDDLRIGKAWRKKYPKGDKRVTWIMEEKGRDLLRRRIDMLKQ
ncbi:suppressor of glycerol defect [Nowakowskiella sp. JEL0407]|nr:suppressor of glycerol defect [Nowakowskiella sp. JEL0407]